MNSKRIPITAICLLSIVYCILLSSCENNSSQKNTEVKSTGLSLFENNCTSCHGSDGKLGALGAKDLSISQMEKMQMMEIITKGKSTMTPFGNMLTQAEIDSVASYVQTLRK